MKVLTLIVSMSIFACQSYGQENNSDFAVNTSCESAMPVCGTLTQNFDQNADGEPCDLPVTLYYSFHFSNTTSNPITLFPTSPLTGSFVYYGPFTDGGLEPCRQVQINNGNFTTGTFELENGGMYSTTYTLPGDEGYYILALTLDQCQGTFKIIQNGDGNIVCAEDIPCTECVTSFSPTPGRYVVSAWVKEDVNDPLISSYTNSGIEVSFQGSTSPNVELFPTGAIIDGWQRIEEVVTVPTDATGINIALNVSTGDAFFDDIRFYPFDGSMMSYVYDPISLRLMAELDERNYATLYEYDEEGKLIRVKKETEKGVMTIQENRDNIIKKN